MRAGGGGAVLIEAKTYRRKGHAEHDDQRYVSSEEIEWWEKNNDPIDRFERYLTQGLIGTREKLDEITADIIRKIDEDVAWAESSPMPEAEQAAYGVFDNNIVPPAFRPEVCFSGSPRTLRMAPELVPRGSSRKLELGLANGLSSAWRIRP